MENTQVKTILKKENNKKKMKNSKKLIYIIMLVFGGLCSLLLICTIRANETYDVVWNIIAMFGSGVFCSALVAWLIETRDEKQLKREQFEKRKKILSRFESSLKYLLRQELKNLTSCVVLIENNNTMRKKTMRQRDVISKIKCTIDEIKEPNGKVHQINDAVGIEYCKTQEWIHKKIYQNTLYAYSNLLNVISCVLEDLNLYLATDIFEEEKIEELENIKSSIDYIIDAARVENEGMLLEEKRNFFERLTTCLMVLGFNLDDEVECYCYE